VYQTDDGGYIVVGENIEAWAMNARADVWVVKTNSSGNMIWKIKHGEYERYDSALSVIQTDDGGYAVAGYSWTSAENQNDMLLIKIMRANPPVATFTYSPENASVQQEILFNASASSDLDEDIVSYVWDFDDGNVSTVSSPIISHTYESPRIYNVTLTITDSEELNSSLSKEVWVRVPTYIEMSIIDWAFIGFEIGVSGRLHDIYGHYFKNENVTLQWYIGGNTWTLLGWDITNDYGDYTIVWNPTTVMSYQLKVRWSGNQTFFPAENTKTISIRSIPTRISLGLWSSTSLIGFQVAISGDLISDIRAVSNTPVLLSYSVTGGQTWNDMTQAITESDGHYSAIWMPTATGNYLVKASWAGNSTYPQASKTVCLAVIPSGEQNVFSVISNSTVSELSFESANKELTFTVEGLAGTMGYADVYVAKTLIADIEDVEVKLNGTEIEYTAAPSLGDSWLIHVTYQHSAHIVAVNLGASLPQQGETAGIDALTAALFIAVLAIGIIALVTLTRRRFHRKTASIEGE
jgi:PKD repeat protein